MRRSLVAAFGLTLLAVLASVLWSAGAEAQSPPANPFSLGGVEGQGGQPTTGIASYLLSKQAEFTRAMTAAARAVRTDTGALWTLVGIAFAYGIFHAAGPGHGKAIVASYVVANESMLRRGAAVATLAAGIQGAVAIALVVAIGVVVGGGRRMLSDNVNWIELISFSAIALFGAWLFFRKARALLQLLRGEQAACNHTHLPAPQVLARNTWREGAAAAVAAGIRPCSGAILILVFTLAQGALWAGILAVIAMAVGVAITTSAIAAMAVHAKGLALRIAGGRGQTGALVMTFLETCAALAVLLLGITLVLAQWPMVMAAR